MQDLSVCLGMKAEHVLRPQCQHFVAAERLHRFAEKLIAVRLEEFPNAIVVPLHLDEDRRTMPHCVTQAVEHFKFETFNVDLEEAGDDPRLSDVVIQADDLDRRL